MLSKHLFSLNPKLLSKNYTKLMLFTVYELSTQELHEKPGSSWVLDDLWYIDRYIIAR